jgi:hypothetical protein
VPHNRPFAPFSDFLSLPSSLPPSSPSFSRSTFFPPCLAQSSVSTCIASSYSRSRSFIMDISLVYAIVMGGSFCLLLLINSLPLITRLVRYLSPLVSKHLIHRYILHRHRLLGPWSRADVLVQLIYIAGNICCFEFWDTTTSQAGRRAGTLAMINLIPLFAVPHLSTLADLLGMTLSTFRQIHRSAGVMAVMLTIFHVLIMIASQPSFPLDLPQNKFAVIVSSLLATFLR